MSLTSYRAAPPRDSFFGGPLCCFGPVWLLAAAGLPVWMKRACGLYRFGGDLLSRVLGRSTIGAAALNGRVRDGIGCFARAVTAKPAERALAAPFWGAAWATRDGPFGRLSMSEVDLGSMASVTRLPPDRDQAIRAISTGQLSASPRLHLRPIDVVVFHGPQGRPGFEGGFPLRCLQRLSCPHIATLHCRWHDNRSTSGAFTPVLSY